MKTLFLFSILTWFSAMAAMGQTSASDKLYLQLEGADGITIMSLSKDLIDMVDLMVDDDDSKHVTGPLKKIKMMICSEDNDEKITNAIIQTFEKSPFQEIEKEEDPNDGRIFILRRGRKIKECHVLSGHSEGMILLSFYGNFNIEDIDKLTEKAKDIH